MVLYLLIFTLSSYLYLDFWYFTNILLVFTNNILFLSFHFVLFTIFITFPLLLSERLETSSDIRFSIFIGALSLLYSYYFFIFGLAPLRESVDV
jgi:hypothetical protein